jgi:hypothetical protein
LKDKLIGIIFFINICKIIEIQRFLDFLQTEREKIDLELRKERTKSSIIEWTSFYVRFHTTFTVYTKQAGYAFLEMPSRRYEAVHEGFYKYIFLCEIVGL